MVVDCHVHTRDFREREKETIEHALNVARRAGVSAIFAMPNTKPPLIDEDRVRDYIRLADDCGVDDVFFGVYMGLTLDTEQVRKAVETYRNLHPRVVGFKIYAGKSTNPETSVVRVEDQYSVFEALSSEGFNGVTSVHPEKEELMDNRLFIPENPVSHATHARPPEAEIGSVRDLLDIAKTTGYSGKIDFKHISTPESVGLITTARREGIDAACWVCPHHLIFNYEAMRGENGLFYKMNPPLRKPGDNIVLIDQLACGNILGVETDHAPHTLRDKSPPDCASGVSALHAWPLFLEYFSRHGFTSSEIRRITHDAAAERHSVEIPYSKVSGKYIADAYEVDIWKELERKLNPKS